MELANGSNEFLVRISRLKNRLTAYCPECTACFEGADRPRLDRRNATLRTVQAKRNQILDASLTISAYTHIIPANNFNLINLITHAEQLLQLLRHHKIVRTVEPVLKEGWSL